jgi:hypothetical protein
MKRIAVLFATFAFMALVQIRPAQAEEFKNLKVLDGSNKKGFDNAMKSMSKGLGVKCNACHVKGEFESDDKETKLAGRTFFTAVVGEKDAAKRDAALAELLKVLKVEKAKEPKAIWTAVDSFKKK